MAHSAPPPLETLHEIERGRLLPLTRTLAGFYGPLRFPMAPPGPHVVSNFVTTLDGVVSFNVKGHVGGGDISGFNREDLAVMGLLRAVADAVIVGSGTLGAAHHHIWIAEDVYPALANEYRQLRKDLGKPEPPLNVIITGSGQINLTRRVFVSGEVPALIVTTATGANQLRKQKLPDSVDIRAVRGPGRIRAASIIDEVCKACNGKLLLVEGGPNLLGQFYAERVLHEQFLTLAPQIAGREPRDRRLSLVMGRTFWPRAPLWGNLVDLRRSRSHLFLRYSFD